MSILVEVGDYCDVFVLAAHKPATAETAAQFFENIQCNIVNHDGITVLRIELALEFLAEFFQNPIYVFVHHYKI